MTSPWFGQLILFAYALLLAVGGTIGYIKAKSAASLIAGIVSAALIMACFGISIVAQWHRLAYGLGMVIAIGLLMVFGGRYMEKKKFMPSGLLALISLAVAILLILAMIMVRTAVPQA